MRGSTLLAVGVAGAVALAAIVSGIRGSGDTSPPAGSAPAAPTATATTTGDALPIGDVRRLPALQEGTYPGRLFGFTANLCVVVVADLASFEITNPGGVEDACTIWPSPGNRALASRRPPPEDVAVLVATVLDGRPAETGIDYVPGRAIGALTVTDDGTVAACDGTSVRLAREGRVQTVLQFTPVDGLFDERCVTGAVGNRIVQVGDGRRTLIDIATRKVVRRLAEPVRSPVVALTSSADGLVIVADLADGPPQGTVFDKGGNVVMPRTQIARGVSIRKIVLAKGGGAVAVQSARGWEVTNLSSQTTLVAPRGAQINDVTFSPDGTVAALATEHGVVFADVSNLSPKSFWPQEYQALVWLPPAELETF
jgi:hypothetical protein